MFFLYYVLEDVSIVQGATHHLSGGMKALQEEWAQEKKDKIFGL